MQFYCGHMMHKFLVVSQHFVTTNVCISLMITNSKFCYFFSMFEIIAFDKYDCKINPSVLIKLSLRGLWYLRNNALRISIIYPLLYIIALNVMIESIKRLIKIFYHLPFQMQCETCLRGHVNLSTYVTCTCNYMLSNIFFLLLSLLSFISLSITNAMILQQT